MKVDILGTEYKIYFLNEKEDKKLSQCDGYIDYSAKKIVVYKFKKDLMSVEDLEIRRNEALRHEIVHGFLHESGLCANSGKANNWAICEEIVDWIALQAPKMLKAFEQCGCL